MLIKTATAQQDVMPEILEAICAEFAEFIGVVRIQPRDPGTVRVHTHCDNVLFSWDASTLAQDFRSHLQNRER